MMTYYQQKIKNLPDIKADILAKYLEQVKISKQEIVEELQSQKIAPLNISYQESDLEEIEDLAKDIKTNFKKVAIFGVGGSSLGAKTITAIKDNHDIEIEFFESIDSDTVRNRLEKIDLRNTFFLVISKSGQTIETTCQTLITIEKLRTAKISDLAPQFLFITENKNSDIGKIAESIGAKIQPHPSNIGGRFSYLTIVGLLPAALIGANIRKIRNGAQQTLENFINQDEERNKIATISAYQLYLFDQNFGANVIMPYVDCLKDFTDWYRQLWAESLGKNGFGSTPINSMGTVDQHSQLQLYLDGPKDKFFTFITNSKPKNDFLIKDLNDHQTRFGNKNLSQIVKAEQESTIEILALEKLPIRIIELDGIDEEVLSALMMQMFLETILIAKVKKINPFDQPAVELRKILSKKMLDENKF